jgi:class 3 adenylate cyclase
MKCSNCERENTVEAKFCEQCGAPLPRCCAHCLCQVSSTANFCHQCGHPLTSVANDSRFTSPKSYTPQNLADKILTAKVAMEGERKQVTVLFADVKGSMDLFEDRDPEAAQKLLDPLLERMIEAVHHYEGTVNRVMGDGIMALFGAPIAHEDHAVRACYAALRMQEAIAQYANEVERSQGVSLAIRVGLDSGEIIVCAIGKDLHMDYTVVGQTANLAARMEQMARAGSVLATADTFQLVEGYITVKPLDTVSVKGIPHPVQLYEVTGAASARTRLQAAAGRGLTRFVGRDVELEQLHYVQQIAGHGRLDHRSAAAMQAVPTLVTSNAQHTELADQITEHQQSAARGARASHFQSRRESARRRCRAHSKRFRTGRLRCRISRNYCSFREDSTRRQAAPPDS